MTEEEGHTQHRPIRLRIMRQSGSCFFFPYTNEEHNICPFENEDVWFCLHFSYSIIYVDVKIIACIKQYSKFTNHKNNLRKFKHEQSSNVTENREYIFTYIFPNAEANGDKRMNKLKGKSITTSGQESKISAASKHQFKFCKVMEILGVKNVAAPAL